MFNSSKFKIDYRLLLQHPGFFVDIEEGAKK